MKAISIKQPWANRIASGEKTIETRTWTTDYRGELLICSSRSPEIRPAGYALAIARLVDSRPMRKEDEDQACCPFEEGLFSLVLKDIRKIKAFPVKGKLGLFDVELMVLAKKEIENE
jgi:hypothetical protein